MISQKSMKFALSLSLILALSACSSIDRQGDFWQRIGDVFRSDETFPTTSYVIPDNAIQLRVNQFYVDDEALYQGRERLPLHTRYVETELSEPPRRTIASWAGSRFFAAGGPHSGRLVINQASLVEEELPLPPDDSLFFGWTDQKTPVLYTLDLSVTVEIMNKGGYVLADTTSRVTRQHKFSSPPSVSKRDAALNNMMTDAMNQLDLEISQGAQIYLHHYLAAPEFGREQHQHREQF